MPRDLVLGRACSSHVKVVLRHVLERVDLHASVVRINGNIIRIGYPSVSSYDATRFGAGARVFESCKGCVAACFGAC